MAILLQVHAGLPETILRDPHKPGEARRYESGDKDGDVRSPLQVRRNSGLGRGFGGLDLGQEDVADVVPVGDEGQRGMRVLVGGVHARGGAIQGGPRETHEQLRLSPRRLERIGDGAFELVRPISA